MSTRLILVLVLIVLALVVLFAIFPSGNDGPSSPEESANPHAIDQN